MRRVLLVVALLATVAGISAFWYFRTCCTPPLHAPANSTAARPAPSASPLKTGPSAADANIDTARGDASAAPAPKRRAAVLPNAAPPPAAKEPAAVATGSLRIVSDVAGAQVFLNRDFVGTTPTTAANLAPGEYQLNVAAPGYDNHVETITIAAGEREISVSFRAIRLDASVDVIHKHRFGSCKGRLVAAPDGIRYETTDKDDAFRAGLLDLETFSVDYLNKNLRVQLRKGKRYDFTDPEGNADRLFVFHRDVDRARERLRAER